MAKKLIDIYVAMNEDGDYECGIDAEDASTRLEDNVGGVMCRIVRVALRVSPPELVDAGELDIADDTQEVSVELPTETINPNG